MPIGRRRWAKRAMPYGTIKGGVSSVTKHEVIKKLISVHSVSLW